MGMVGRVSVSGESEASWAWFTRMGRPMYGDRRWVGSSAVSIGFAQSVTAADVCKGKAERREICLTSLMIIYAFGVRYSLVATTSGYKAFLSLSTL